KGLDTGAVEYVRHLLMNNGSITQGAAYLTSALDKAYSVRLRAYEEKWEASSNSPFLRAPEKEPVPQKPWRVSGNLVLSIALRDLSMERDHLLRELAAHVGTHSISLDHTRRCAKKCTETHTLGQSLTIMTDYSIILGSYLTPTTSVRYAKPALDEIIRRHKTAGVELPKILY
ncbi:hypothetical protein FOZ63_016857, partial [Perkinsus olseni]